MVGKIMRIRARGALLLAIVAIVGVGQGPPSASLARVFMANPEILCAVELDGTLAWATPHGGVLGTTSGIAVDGHGYVWHVVGNPMGFWLQRYTTTVGALDLQVNLNPTAIWGPGMPAIDRDGNCYVSYGLPNAAAPYGVESRLSKYAPNGSLLWDIDLTPEVLLSTPPTGLVFDSEFDEDGNLWVSLDDRLANSAGGRLVKLDPQGTLLWSVQAGGISLAVNPDRTVRIIRTSSCGLSGLCVSRFTLEGALVDDVALGAPFFPGEWVTHVSSLGRWHQWSGGVMVGVPGAPQPGLGYLPLPTMTTTYGFGTLFDAQYGCVDVLGRLWTQATAQTFGQELYHAVRHGSEPPGGGNLPIITSTPLGSPYSYGLAHPGNMGGKLTAYTWCLNVDPWGDLDGDGCSNRNEIMAGTNPCDPTSAQGLLSVSGLAVGQIAALQMQAPGAALSGYVSILGVPGTRERMPDQRSFGPSFLDPLAAWWLDPANALVSGAAGVFDAAGAATATVAVPGDPALAGLSVAFGYVSLDPQWSLGIEAMFGPASLTIGAGLGGP